MNYKVWVDLLGRTNDDPLVKEQLRLGGITKRQVVPRDEIDLYVDIDDMTLYFMDVDLFEGVSGGAGTGVLTSVTMHTDVEPWPDPLDIRLTDTRETLRARFGTPEEEEEYWDQWPISEKLHLTGSYTLDGKTLKGVTIGIEEPE